VSPVPPQVPPRCTGHTTSINAAVCNVLFEGHYRSHAQCAIMPYHQRIQLATQWVDRIYQERPVHLWLLQEASQEFVQWMFNKRRSVKAIFPPHMSPANESCCIVYDSEFLEPRGHPTIHQLRKADGQPTPKIALAQLFMIRSTQQRFQAVSAHLPFESSSQGHGAVLQGLLAAPFFAHRGGTFVLGGDFNMESSAAAGELAAAFPPDFWVDASAALPFTSRPPGRHSGKIDYLYVTHNQGAAPAGDCSIIPADPTLLLPHGPAAAVLHPNSFFSDHGCILSGLIISS
jgi:hypothetical protein